MNAFLLMMSMVPNGGCAVHVNKVAVVKQEVAVVQPVVVPLYSFTYLPPITYQAQAYVAPPPPVPQQPLQQAPQALTQPLEEPCDLCQEIRKLRLEVARLKGVPVAEATIPLPQPQPLTAPNILATKCVGCHGQTNAATKGGGFILASADGRLNPLSLAEKRRIVDLITKDKMPKPPMPPLTPQEKEVLKTFFEGVSP